MYVTLHYFQCRSFTCTYVHVYMSFLCGTPYNGISIKLYNHSLCLQTINLSPALLKNFWSFWLLAKQSSCLFDAWSMVKRFSLSRNKTYYRQYYCLLLLMLFLYLLKVGHNWVGTSLCPAHLKGSLNVKEGNLPACNFHAA